MLSLQLPTAVFPVPRLISLPHSHLATKKLFFSPFKLCSTVGKRTAERPSIHERFSPEASSILKPSLAASVSAADTETEGKETAIQLPGELRAELMPKHVAIIMDGNGRWAKMRGLPIQHGHKAGSMNLRHIISNCCKLGIKVFTVFAFSTENWKRSQVEVDFLMRFIEDFIQNDVKELIERHGIHFSAIGNRSKLPESLQSAIYSAEESSKGNKGMQLVSALSYSGHYDIIDATKKIASKAERGIVRAKDVDETLFEQQLMTNSIEFPNPDLLIRTSGELRVSNFMLWQLAYTEFYFSDKVFPDFGEADFITALVSFQQRQRRYGERMK